MCCSPPSPTSALRRSRRWAHLPCSCAGPAAPRSPALRCPSTGAGRRTDMIERVPRVVIVGAGFGGLAAAKRLAGQRVDVTLVDRRNHHLFQPLLYQVATAALSPADIAAPIR